MEFNKLVGLIKKCFNEKDFEKSIPVESYEQYILLLEEFEKEKRLLDYVSHDELVSFLFYACQKFDRWNPPTPFVLTPKYRIYFEKCFFRIIKLGTIIENVAQFEISRIKWDIFDFLHLKNVDINLYNELKKQNFFSQLENIEKLITGLNLSEVEKTLYECKNIIEAVQNCSLTTRIKTRIPVSPIKKKTLVNSIWEGISINVYFEPIWQEVSQSFAKIEGDSNTLAVVPMTLSQWQNSYCEVIIELNSLIDPSKEAPALSSHPTEKMPHDTWPFMFNCTFDILDNVTWHIRSQTNTSGRWMLLPNDLATHTYELLADSNCVHWIMKDPPGLFVRISKVEENYDILALDISRDIIWHEKCYMLAHSFLETGATNEALFWINVATEALFESRSKVICENNESIDYSELNSEKSYWSDAKELIKTKFPYIVDEIDWPESKGRIPSWYQKIKYLSQKANLKESRKSITKKYNSVSRYRNALFHGASSQRISFEEAKKAIDSFLWLEENFCEKNNI